MQNVAFYCFAPGFSQSDLSGLGPSATRHEMFKAMTEHCFFYSILKAHNHKGKKNIHTQQEPKLNMITMETRNGGNKEKRYKRKKKKAE